ncbi:MAG TPA: hypothetical protein VM847_14830 [Tahibacter sp.]|nr:hypothetical protein [Tahibacter sp.]
MGDGPAAQDDGSGSIGAVGIGGAIVATGGPASVTAVCPSRPAAEWPRLPGISKKTTPSSTAAATASTRNPPMALPRDLRIE